MNPFKVYNNKKLFDIIYSPNGKSMKDIKEELINEQGYPKTITLRRYIKDNDYEEKQTKKTKNKVSARVRTF